LERKGLEKKELERKESERQEREERKENVWWGRSGVLGESGGVWRCFGHWEEEDVR